MSEQISPWLTFLGLLPFAIGLGLFFIYLLQRNWRVNALGRLVTLRTELRAMQSAGREMQKEAQTFSVEDPEPFGELVDYLIQGLRGFEDTLSDLYRRYAELHMRANALAHTTGADWLKVPLEWFRLDQETMLLKSDLVSGEEELKILVAPAERLHRLGWEMASHSREILEKARRTGEMFLELSHEALIEDPVLDSAWQDTCEWEETLLAQVPIVYLQDDEPSVLANADKETTAHVYRVIKTAEPAVRLLHEKAESCQAQYAQLAGLIRDVNREYLQVTTAYKQLQEHTYLPIEWEKTRAVMTRLQVQLDAVGAVIRKRSLDQLKADLAALGILHTKIAELGEHVQDVNEQQNKLAVLLDQIVSQQEDDWLGEAILLSEKVSQYAPANFSGDEPAQVVQENLKRFSALWSQVIAVDPNQPVRESALGLLAGQAEQVSTSQIALRQQSELLQLQFDELQDAEQKLRDALLRKRALVGQASALIGSNPFLKRLARNEPEQIAALLEKLLLELDQREQGSVNGKVTKAAPALQRVELLVTHWADSLEKEVAARKESLAEKTEVLESRLKMDEPAITEAVRLLKQAEILQVSKELMQAEDVMLTQVERLKSLNQAWQSCVVNLQRIDEFGGTVLDMYSKAEKHRLAAVDRFTRAESIAAEELTWPPCTQRLSNERLQLQTLEQRWNSLQQEPLKAIQVVAKLSDLAERYQAADGQLSRLLETAQQEQGRVREFDKRLEESKKMWQRQAAQNASNRTVQSGVQNLIEEINRDYEALKRRYVRGLIQYAQALQGIRQICRKIDDAAVQVDGQQEMDINGIVQRRV